MNAPPHPAYRGRYLPAFTREQLDALPGKSSAVVIIPTGAIEQHGPHLPLGVDAMLGQAILTATLARLPARVPVYVGPAITYGKSNEHGEFAGTLSVSTRTLHHLLKAAARQLHALGFRTMAILNTHGGNASVLVPTLREIQVDPGLHAGLLKWTDCLPLSPQEAAWGFHAGQAETSLLLALAPHLVRMREAVCEYPAHVDDPGELRPDKAAATSAWKTRDLSRSGVIGDATKGSSVDGAAWLDRIAETLVARILALAERVAGSGPH